MDIFVWGRPLRQVQTCESRDVYILGNLYGICIIIIIIEEEKKIKITFNFLINWTRKILSRGVWYLLPNLDSGWVSEGIVVLVQLISIHTHDWRIFRVHFWIESILYLNLYLTLYLNLENVPQVPQIEVHFANFVILIPNFRQLLDCIGWFYRFDDFGFWGVGLGCGRSNNF